LICGTASCFDKTFFQKRFSKLFANETNISIFDKTFSKSSSFSTNLSGKESLTKETFRKKRY